MSVYQDRVSRNWPRWARRLRRTLGSWRNDPYRVVLDALGSRGPVGGVPGDWMSADIRARGRSANRKLGVMVGNDGFDLSSWWYYDDARPGDPPSLGFSLNRDEAHQLAWFIVRWWATEWFGLRRVVWYWALHRSVTRFKARQARTAR